MNQNKRKVLQSSYIIIRMKCPFRTVYLVETENFFAKSVEKKLKNKLNSIKKCNKIYK